MEQETARQSVYLDGHATTPLSPEALEAMTPWWLSAAANAHSPHVFGQRAAAAVERARGQIAGLLDVAPSEIIFTSGATESNNLALLGVAGSLDPRDGAKRNIVVSAIEHKSVLACASELARRGWEVRFVPVDRNGRVNLHDFASLVDDRTLLASVMIANNEVGTVQPLSEVVSICRDRGVLVHADAAQAIGKIPVSLADLDYASVSSHKMYGPVGVGALFVSSAATIRPQPLTFGGSQEGGLRPGTLPVPLIVGFGAAAAVCSQRMIEDGRRAEVLRRRLLDQLSRKQVKFSINGHPADRIPGSVHLLMAETNALDLIMRLGSRVLVAEGSACSSGNIQHSHVLKAMKLSADEAARCVRIFISRYNTLNDIEYAAEQIALATGGSHQ